MSSGLVGTDNLRSSNLPTAGYIPVSDGNGGITWTAPGVAVEAFPVGALFISEVSTDPNTLLGYGTWASCGSGRVLVGLDSGDTDFDTAGETGGAKTHTHGPGSLATSSDSAGTPAGTNSAPTFTGSALAGHTHGDGSLATDSVSGGTPAGTVSAPTFTGNALSTHTHSADGSLATDAVSAGTPAGTIGGPSATASCGLGATLVANSVHIHTFTGSAMGTHSHDVTGNTSATSAGTPSGTNSAPTFTGSALSGHSHDVTGTTGSTSAGTPAGTVSAPTFTGSALSGHGHTVASGVTASGSNVMPYYVVYFWRRTA